jgi:hypothetical protein
MTDTLQNITCPTCGAPLSIRPTPSKRAWEKLLICSNGHIGQGCITYGHWRLYHTGPKNIMAKTAKIGGRTYPETWERLRKAGYSQQQVIDLGIGLAELTIDKP